MITGHDKKAYNEIRASEWLRLYERLFVSETIAIIKLQK